MPQWPERMKGPPQVVNLPPAWCCVHDSYIAERVLNFSLSAVPSDIVFTSRLLQHYGDTGVEVRRLEIVSENHSVSKRWLDYLDSE